MTVSSTNTKNSYSGDGSTTVFTYNFPINSQAELAVISRSSLGTETTKTLNSDYTIVDNGASGGSVTFTTAPASSETIVLIRDTNLTQTTDYLANDPFPAETHEAALDKMTFQVQEMQEELGRSLKISKTNTMTSTEFTNDAADRALKVFAFDSSGELSVAQELGSFKGNWATATSYKQRDIVKDTSTNNVFFVNTSHISTGSQPLTTNANAAKYSLIVDAESATTSAANAATSETNAANSATAASASQTAAASSATAAAASETAAGTSETNAGTSATNAASSATAAATSATNAATSETNAASSASTATTQASTATTQASTATTQATNASNSASAASTSATNAASSATAASNSASAASTSETNAGTSATNAASSATAAASSATSASTSATDATNAKNAAEAVFDDFDDSYLGAKSSDPTTDNDGDALTDGALYYDTTLNRMKVYDLATTSWLLLSPTSADQANINTVAGSIANVNTTASNITGVNSFAERYRVDSSDPTTSLDTGDLVFNTSASALKYYDGSSWNAIVAGTMTDVIQDTTPQLGGSLDVNGQSIVSVSNGNIAITPDGSGKVVMDGLSYPTADGTSGQFLSTDGSGTLSFASVPAGVGGATGVDFNDDVKARFGTGNDLEIFHESSSGHSKIKDGSGVFKILGDSVRIRSADDSKASVNMNAGGAVEIHHNNSLTASTDANSWIIHGGKDLALSAGTWTGETGGKIQRHSTHMYFQTQDAGSWIFRNQSGYEGCSINASNGSIVSQSNITAYSDIRLKKDVRTIENALDKVSKLRGVEYTRKSNDEREIGVIAQEVKEIVPELVSIEDNSNSMGDGIKDVHTMKYQNTVGLLIEAIKDLKAEIEELKKG